MAVSLAQTLIRAMIDRLPVCLLIVSMAPFVSEAEVYPCFDAIRCVFLLKIYKGLIPYTDKDND
jgi:hypothetical protein